MEDRPVGDVFDRVVRSVVAAPAFDAQEIAALVEVTGEELFAGRGVGSDQFPLEYCPGGGDIGVSTGIIVSSHSALRETNARTREFRRRLVRRACRMKLLSVARHDVLTMASLDTNQKSPRVEVTAAPAVCPESEFF